MLSDMDHVSNSERRNRLARRHGIAPSSRYADPLSATRAMTVLHATEAATVHLSLHARVDDLTVADVETELYDVRRLVKQVGMRRTQFVFPRELIPAALGSASARVADQEGSRTARDVERAGWADDGRAWLEDRSRRVVEVLADGVPRSVADLRRELPEVEGKLDLSPNSKWGRDVPVAPRILTHLGVRGQAMRAGNDGHWRINRPTWTTTRHWLGAQPAPMDAAEGYAEITRRWLWTFGPATERDLQWWLGSTVTAARRALAEVGAVEVALDDGTGWVLPGDLEPEEGPEPWAALLPVLDPTVMGWKERGFFLGDLESRLFDRNGNAGTTAWWNGRVVGCWIQDEGGEVLVVPATELPAEATAALEAEAARLTRFLDGVRISTVYPSSLMREARLALPGA